MTDKTTTTPPQPAAEQPPEKHQEPLKEPPKPASLRSGTPKEIATAACRRKRPHQVDSFAGYLACLADDQSSIYQKKRPRQETLNQQMDMLDAMFTYLAVYADWTNKPSYSYSAALRAQKQFCSTMNEIKNLKLPKAPASPTPTFPIDQKIGVPHGTRLDN